VIRAVVSILALTTASLLTSAPPASVGAGRAIDEQRAFQSYALMERYYYVPGTRSYVGTYPSAGPAQLWPYSQALAAALELARIPGGAARTLASVPGRISRLASYRAPVAALAYAPVYHGRGNPFYDDNVWIGIELVEASDLLHSRADLTAAGRVFVWLEAGWDTKANACRGGVYWLMPRGKYWNRSPGSRYRAAVSTVNAALLGVLLYEHTGRRADLRWSERAYRWSQRCLGTPDALLADHIDAQGNVTPDIHSYNQGALVAAAVDLYRATGSRRYLADAVRTANASLAAFRDPLHSDDAPIFLAIYYGDLLQLAPYARGAEIRAAVNSFASQAWAQGRDPATGLFHFGHTFSTLLDQAAMVQVYAELALTT
jgi:hypothetical protein